MMMRRTFVVLAIALAVLCWLLWPQQLTLPKPETFAHSEAVFVDRHSAVIHRLRIDKHSRHLGWVKLDDMSPALLQLVLKAEDKRFYEHLGVDTFALVSAAWNNCKSIFTGTSLRGASTLSMQLAGMLDDPTPATTHQRRTIFKKLRQIQLALALERQASKREILEAYLNLVHFRGEQQGIAAASMAFFAKTPRHITQSESAVLASLLASPQAKSGLVAKRACRLIQCADEVAMMPVWRLNKPHRSMGSDQYAPHLAQRLLNEAQQNKPIERGQTIVTTLDLPLQRYAQQALQEHIRELNKQQVEDGAVVVLENRTGKVLAYVGSSGGYSDTPHVDAASALRQAGSTLKPFIYGLAIDQRRLTAASLLDDSAVAIRSGDAQYLPRNYSDQYLGWVSVRKALGSSLNIPAVRTAAMLDLNAVTAILRNAGLHSVRESGDHYGYSLALGSADVRLVDLTNAYRTLANEGRYSAVGFREGSSLGEVKQTLSAEAAFIVSDILSDNEARVATFGLDSALRLPFRSSVKTGTSKDMRDNWCVGYSEDFTIGVWVGNASGAPMRGVSGVSGAAPVWNALMKYTHQHLRVGNPQTKQSTPQPTNPQNVVHATTKFISINEPERKEFFIKGTEQPVFALAENTAKASRVLLQPVDGARYAFDPDIPRQKQNLKLAWNSSAITSQRLQVFMNDQPVKLKSADAQLWPIIVGNHTLEVRRANGEVLEAVRFQVSGRQ